MRRGYKSLALSGVCMQQQQQKQQKKFLHPPVASLQKGKQPDGRWMKAIHTIIWWDLRLTDSTGGGEMCTQQVAGCLFHG